MSKVVTSLATMTPVEKDHGLGLNGAVAAVLRGERAAVGMEISELADLSEVPYVSLQRYLNGKRAFTLEVLEKVANALELTTDGVLRQAQARLARPNVDEETYRAMRAGDPLGKSRPKKETGTDRFRGNSARRAGGT